MVRGGIGCKKNSVCVLFLVVSFVLVDWGGGKHYVLSLDCRWPNCVNERDVEPMIAYCV